MDDPSSRNRDLLTELHFLKNLQVITARLQIGDFLIDDSVIIERKTAADFAASLLDGRLFSQAARIVQSPLRPAYIIEGNAEDWKALKVKRAALQGALISLMLTFDIPVLRSNDPQETARLLFYAGQQLVRARTGEQVPTRQIKAKRRSTRQRRVLQSLPGIGPDRAKRLLEHFGSVRACLAADAEALAAINGIGPTTARRIVETVEEERIPYGVPFQTKAFSVAPLLF